MNADFILKSKNVFDGLSDVPEPKSIVIKDKLIVAVGEEEEIEAQIDPSTKIIDVGERLVTYGLHDSHVHLILAGMYQKHGNLASAKSEEEAAKMLFDFEQEHPSEGWIIGFGWYHVFWDHKRIPTKKTLDQYFPDRPVFLLNAELHGAWVNSKALEIAGITEDTPDPFGGYFDRDENGVPLGHLYETALGEVGKFALTFSLKREREYIEAFMNSAKKIGFTSVNDMQPYFGMEMGNLDAYQTLDQEDKLTIRVHVAKNLLIDIEELTRIREQCHSNRLKVNLLKQFLDGVPTTHTGLMIEDYSDAKFLGDRGNCLSPLTEIRNAILEAHRRDFSVRLHSCGDLSARYALDYYEEAIKKYGKTKSRHGIEHIEVIDKKDIPRIKELEIIPSMQPEHLAITQSYKDNPYTLTLGPERIQFSWPWKTMLNQAGVIAIGSDCPVVDNNPFLEIYRAVTRVHNDGEPKGGWNPQERLTMAEVLRGYTYGGAYGVSREKEMGTIQKGMFADLVVFSRNLFELNNPTEILDTQIDMTIMDGKIIYEK